MSAHVATVLVGPGTGLVVVFHEDMLPDLRKTLNRAMNTWEPRDQPEWLQHLSDYLDQRMAALAAEKGSDGLRETPVEQP